jgi:hypothetical protein
VEYTTIRNRSYSFYGRNFLTLRGTKCIFTLYSLPLIILLGLRFLLRCIKKKLFPFSWQHLVRRLASKFRYETSILHHWTNLVSWQVYVYVGTCSVEGRQLRIYNRYLVLILTCLSLLNLDLVGKFKTSFYVFYHLLLSQCTYVTVRADWHRLSGDQELNLSSTSEGVPLHPVTWGR